MKKLRIKYIIYALFGLMTISVSCKKGWFEAKSDINQTVPATLLDFEYLLDRFSVMNQGTPGLAEVGSDGHYITENIWATSLAGNHRERDAYTWTNSFPVSNTSAEPDWNKSYERIFISNLVLDGLKRVIPNQNQGKYNEIRGNALFHRAKNYYDLAQIYAQPYYVSSAGSDIGIPLKEGIDVTEQAKRSSVKLTYDQILSDLRNATNLLPVLPVVKSRGSKTAAFALLARTYLAMGEYTNAGLYADSSLQLYNKLIDFNSVSSTVTGMGEFNLETIFYAQRGTTWLSTWATGFYFVDPDLYALYSDNDLRKTRFFTLIGGNVIFKGNYTNTGAGFDGLAVDEQYLIRAECFARAGNIAAAMKDLNDFLKTRWSNTVIYPIRNAIDAEDALRQVLEERKKELCFRNLRWTDLRRLNMDARFKVTLTRTIGGKTYILEPGSYRYTLPIPPDVLNLAPQMKQTPGWD